MALFHAYLNDANDIRYYRRLVTFVNREAADEWWRVISAPASCHAGLVRRISPQFYVQNNTASHDVANFCFPELSDGIPFGQKVFFTDINDRFEHNPTALPQIEITDHISGQWYFIRSKADPFSHWYLRTYGTCLVCGDAQCDAIHASSEYRTRFCVQVRNMADDLQTSENFVMIGRDEISISASEDYVLHINDAGYLRATKGYQGETEVLFGDLKKTFISRAEKQVNGEVWEYIQSAKKGAGEIWELVQ